MVFRRLQKIYKRSCFNILEVSSLGDEAQEVGKCTCLVHGDKSISTIKYISFPVFKTVRCQNYWSWGTKCNTMYMFGPWWQEPLDYRHFWVEEFYVRQQHEQHETFDVVFFPFYLITNGTPFMCIVTAFIFCILL